MQVIPSIVTADPADLERKMSVMEGLTRILQVDIFDGEFVPGYESVEPAALAPWASGFQLIAHLLVYRPEAYLDRITEAGFIGLIFHLGTAADPWKLIREAKQRNLWTGLVLNLDTGLHEAKPFAGHVDEIVFWSVHREHPGVLDPIVLERVRRWRETYASARQELPSLTSVDGGATFENISAIAATRAERIYAGTAIFSGPDPAGNYRELRALADV